MFRLRHGDVVPANSRDQGTCDGCSAQAGSAPYSSAANFSMSPSVPDTMIRSWFDTTVCSVA